MASEKNHTEQFYQLLNVLRDKVGGYRYLKESNGRMEWPQAGVYFFFEKGERRSQSGDGDKIVRIGTHAITKTSRTSLWNRLSQHKGNANLNGNHRGSIFRLLVGTAIMRQDGLHEPQSWGVGSSASKEIRSKERAIEEKVSIHIGAMPFLWLKIDTPTDRDYIEKNSIALISNSNKAPIDLPSADWLGHFCAREKVRASGLWNQNHTDKSYDENFLLKLKQLIERQ